MGLGPTCDPPNFPHVETFTRVKIPKGFENFAVNGPGGMQKLKVPTLWKVYKLRN